MARRLAVGTYGTRKADLWRDCVIVYLVVADGSSSRTERYT